MVSSLVSYDPTCMGKVIGLRLSLLLLLAQKAPDLKIYMYVSVHDVITTNPDISMKNCLLHSSNCRTWFTSSTNCAFSLQHACGLPTTPICWSANIVLMRSRSNITGARGICALRALSSLFCFVF